MAPRSFFTAPTSRRSKRHCLTLELKRAGLRFVSSGDEPLLIAGVATHTLEILEAQPDIDVILVPVAAVAAAGVPGGQDGQPARNRDRRRATARWRAI